jgi:GAF domain-containing protein
MRERAEILGGTFVVHTAPGKGTSISVEVPLAQEVERTGRPVIVNNVQGDDPFAETARVSGVFSGAGLPLRSDGRFLGAVAYVHTLDPVPFKPSEVAFLQQVSRLVALLLDVLQARGKVRRADQ